MNRISNFGLCVKTLAYNSTVGLAHRLWQVGPSRACYKVYSLQGYAVLTKAIGADLEFLSVVAKVCGLNKMRESVEEQRSLVYGTQFIETTYRFMTKGFKDGRGHLMIPDALLAMGSFCDLGKFMHKRDVLPYAEFFTHVANQLGNWKVYLPNDKVYQPFTWPVLKSFTSTPKDFFVFSAAAYDFGRYAIKATQTLVGHHLSDEYKNAENKYKNGMDEQINTIFSPDHSIKQFGNMGKIFLIGCYSTFGKQYESLFATVNVVVQNAGLLSYIIKPFK